MISIKRLLLPLTLVVVSLVAEAQPKRSFSTDDYPTMHTITSRGISANGQWVWHVLTPMQYGDPVTVLHNLKSNKVDSLKRCRRIWIADDGSWIAWQKEPTFLQTRASKKEKKKDNKPEDTLVVFTTHAKERKEYFFPGMKSVVLPSETHGRYLAVLLKMHEDDVLKDTMAVETEGGEQPIKKPEKGKKNEKIHRLLVFDPLENYRVYYEKVESAIWSPMGEFLAWSEHPVDTLPAQLLHLFSTSEKSASTVFLSEGMLTNLLFSSDSRYLAMLEMPDTTKANTFKVKLIETNPGHEIRQVMPSADLVFNRHHPFQFLERTQKLVVQMAYPTDTVPEDTLLKEERYSLDIWTWNDPYLQSQQLNQLDKEKKRGYAMVYDPATGNTLQVEDEKFRRSDLRSLSTGRYVLTYNHLPYAIESTWNSGSRNDIVLVDLELQLKIPIASGMEGSPVISPDHHFLVWYDVADSTWKSMSIATQKTQCISCGLKGPFYNDEFDNPGPAPGYGLSGWGDQGRFVLLNSKFDVWKIDLWGLLPPICLTSKTGDQERYVYRIHQLEKKKLFYEGKERVLFSVFDLITREGGYAELFWHKPGTVHHLTEGPWFFSGLVKAEKADRVIWTRENFNTFPEVWTSGTDFNNARQLSQGGDQYQPFYRGKAELVHWTLPNGSSCDGILYLPENQNNNTHLPMLVTFYERSSRGFHRFNHFAPSRSVINIPYYLSHGYAIFEPDIYYGIGTPGEDALNAVESGTKHVISLGMIDSTRIGIQGQSWGGYQVAWIITRTNLFAAAMAGAPVSNMTSAYGSIRNESGRARLFQYEAGQSRIGKSLWDEGGINRYLNNSPLFWADHVQTPLLMMHNDNDGAVPWSQSVEYYLALRRLQKPSWLLVYNNEAHNLTRWPNRVDLSIRMKQFFDHYLMEEPAPQWMTQGVPALKKGNEDGYFFEE